MLKLHGTAQASPGLRLDGTAVPSADFTRLCEEMDAIKSEQLAWFEKYDLIVCPASDAPPHSARLRAARRPRTAGASQLHEPVQHDGLARRRRALRHVDEAAGLPLGIQVVAQPWRDDVVIAAMAHIEKQTGGWQKPRRSETTHHGATEP